MPALTMILTAAMVVPADGPGNLSSETIQEPLPLNLSGEWEGTLWDSESKDKGSWTVKLNDHWLVIERGIELQRLFWHVTNEGGGKVRARLSRAVCVGIYRYKSGCVIIALRDSKSDSPISFPPRDDQRLLILHRAKPGSLRFLGIAPGTAE